MWNLVWLSNPVQVRCPTGQSWAEFPPKLTRRDKVRKILHLCVLVCVRHREKNLHIILFLSGLILKFNLKFFNGEHE